MRIVLDNMETYIRKHLFDAIRINTKALKANCCGCQVEQGKNLNWWKGIAMGLNKPMETDSSDGFVAAPGIHSQEHGQGCMKMFKKSFHDRQTADGTARRGAGSDRDGCHLMVWSAIRFQPPCSLSITGASVGMIWMQ